MREDGVQVGRGDGRKFASIPCAHLQPTRGRGHRKTGGKVSGVRVGRGIQEEVREEVGDKRGEKSDPGGREEEEVKLVRGSGVRIEWDGRQFASIPCAHWQPN